MYACFGCWGMFQNPVNIHKHGIALKGQSGLCFVASALGSEWQCLASSLSSVQGDYKWIVGTVRENTAEGIFVSWWQKWIAFSQFPMLWNMMQKTSVSFFLIFHMMQKGSWEFSHYATCRTYCTFSRVRLTKGLCGCGCARRWHIVGQYTIVKPHCNQWATESKQLIMWQYCAVAHRKYFSFHSLLLTHVKCISCICHSAWVFCASFGLTQ